MADKKTLELQIKLAAEQAANQIKLFAQDVSNAKKNTEGLTTSQKSLNAVAKTFQTEATRAAASLKLFGGSTNELRNQQAKMKQTVLDLIDHGLKPESVEVQNLVKQYKDLDDQLSKTEAKQDGLMGVISKLKSEIGSLAVVAAAVAVDKAVTDFSKSALAVSDSFRGAKEEFGIMLGDMQAGAGLFDELQKFNFWTPFDIEQTSQAAKVLMAAKVPLGEITDYLTRFGDIAQGNSQKFQSFINAFSKASAKGKADMEVLNVYIDQGVQILDALAQQMGITTAEVVDFSSKGKISFEQFNQALASMASEGGLYYNSMATAAMRLSSVQAGLEESIKSLKASIGDMLAPRVAKILEFITDIVDTINGSPILKGVLLGAITALTVGLNIFAGKALVAVAVKAGLATTALQALGTAAHAMLGPIGWITLAVGAVVGVVAGLASHQQKLAEETNAAALALKKQAQGYDELKIAAENYLSFMEQMSIEDARKVADSYKTIIIPEAEKAVEEAKKKLSETPEFTEIKHSARGGGRVVEWTEKVSNSAYAEAQEELAKAELQLNTYLARQETALDNVKKLEEHAKELVASFGTEWQDKLSSETAKIDEQEQKALDKLNKKAKETIGENYKAHEAYQKELTALQEYYNNKRAEEKAKADEKALKEAEAKARKEKELQDKINKAKKEVLSWLEKNPDLGINGIENARKLAEAELQKSAMEAYGEEYKIREEYTKALGELEAYYDSQNGAKRLESAKAYWEFMANKAAAQGDLLAYAGSTAMSAIADTNIGAIISGFQNGGLKGGMMALIAQLIKGLTSLESFQKALNFVSEIIKKLGNYLEPLLKDAEEIFEEIIDRFAKVLRPLLALIIAISNQITNVSESVLNPIFDLFADFLELLVSLYNDFLVPFSEKLSDFLKTFGISVKPFKKIVYMTEELSAEMEKAQERIKKHYERMESAVEAQLRSQLSALQSQYELGLITREEYEKQAEQYSAKADDEILKVEEEMKEKLEEIARNTYEALDNEGKENVDNAKKTESSDLINFIEKTDLSGTTQAINDAVREGNTGLAVAEIGASLSGIPGAAAIVKDIADGDGGKAVADLLTGGLVSGIENLGNFFGWWDVGSTNIPADQFGMVHKGETIIPRTFADGIRAGELALVGKKNGSTSADSVFVTVNVGGSVVTENQIIDAVYNGIAKGIQQKRYSPLPA